MTIASGIATLSDDHDLAREFRHHVVCSEQPVRREGREVLLPIPNEHRLLAEATVSDAAILKESGIATRGADWLTRKLLRQHHGE